MRDLMPRTSTLLLVCTLCACSTPPNPQAPDSTPDATPDPIDMAQDVVTQDASPDVVDAAPDIDPIYPGVYEGIEAANAYPSDHPLAEGQWRFLRDTWGVEQLDKFPPASFLLGLMESEPEVFGDQFASFGFLPDPSDDFPIGLKQGVEDPSRVATTCALCHVGQLPDGALWLGAPNPKLDFERFLVEVDKRWVAAGHPSMSSEIAYERAALTGPGRTRAETDAFPAFIPVDFPTYFNLDTRAHLNVLGSGLELRSEAYLSIFSAGAGKPNSREALVPFPSEERAGAFLDFLGSLRAPPAPPQDPALVERGRGVFEAQMCGTCHHVGSPELDLVTESVMPGEPELLPGEDDAFPRGTIATSFNHRYLVDGIEGVGIDDEGRLSLIQFIIQNRLKVSMTDGYRTADLAGLWASAPYLHNGSVPTLEDLLKPPAERPATWQNGEFLYDTAIDGNSNAGHVFGTTISEDERAALVAYLKTL